MDWPTKLEGPDDVPLPKTAAPEAIMAFTEIVSDLFRQYPADESAVVPGRRSAASCRQALIEPSYIDSPEKSARRICYMACDTGVPNELIFRPYALLFL